MSWCVLFLLLAVQPEPAPTPTPVTAAPRKLGDVKLKAKPDEVGKKVSSASGTARPDSTALPEREEVPKTRSVTRIPSVPDHLDRDGHGEGWWRARAAKVQEKVAEAEHALHAAEREQAEASNTALAQGGVPSGRLLARLQARVDASREKLSKARRAEDQLEEDARRADAYPGWLR